MLALLRRLTVTVVGVVVVVLGLVLMVLPGPGVLVLAVGLGILATEYAWARRALVTARERARLAAAKSVANPARTGVTVVVAVGLGLLGVAFLLAPDLPLATPFTGAGLLAGAVALVAATLVSYRSVRRASRR